MSDRAAKAIRDAANRPAPHHICPVRGLTGNAEMVFLASLHRKGLITDPESRTPPTLTALGIKQADALIAALDRSEK
jgi:hypothetical protein